MSAIDVAQEDYDRQRPPTFNATDARREPSATRCVQDRADNARPAWWRR